MEATVDDTPALPGQNLRLPTGEAYDRLTPLQRRAMVGAIAGRARGRAVGIAADSRGPRGGRRRGADVRQPGRSADAAGGDAAAASSATHTARASPDRARAASDRRCAVAGAGSRSSCAAAARADTARARAGRRRGARRAARTAATAAAQSIGLCGPVSGAAPGRVPAPFEAARRDRRGHAARLHRRGGSRSRCPGQSHIGSPPSRRRGHGSGAEGALQAAQRERSGGIRLRPGAGRFSIGEMT